MICSIASMLGGLAGYAIGFGVGNLWKLILSVCAGLHPGKISKHFGLVCYLGLAVGISSRFLSHTLQGVHHRQRSARDEYSTIPLSFRSESFGAVLSGRLADFEVWVTDEGENRQALQPPGVGFWSFIGRWLCLFKISGCRIIYSRASLFAAFIPVFLEKKHFRQGKHISHCPRFQFDHPPSPFFHLG